MLLLGLVVLVVVGVAIVVAGSGILVVCGFPPFRYPCLFLSLSLLWAPRVWVCCRCIVAVVVLLVWYG